MITPWAKRAAQIRTAAEAAEISQIPGYARTQERDEYLQMAYEGQRSSKTALLQRQQVEEAGNQAVDTWSDSEESESLMGGMVVS